MPRPPARAQKTSEARPSASSTAPRTSASRGRKRARSVTAPLVENELHPSNPSARTRSSAVSTDRRGGRGRMAGKTPHNTDTQHALVEESAGVVQSARLHTREGSADEDDERSSRVSSAASAGAAGPGSVASESSVYDEEDEQPSDASYTDNALVARLEKQIVEYHEVQQQIADLLRWKEESTSAAATLNALRKPTGPAVPVLRLVVSGEQFVVPVHTLVGRDPDTFFHALLCAMAAQPESGAHERQGHVLSWQERAQRRKDAAHADTTTPATAVNAPAAAAAAAVTPSSSALGVPHSTAASDETALAVLPEHSFGAPTFFPAEVFYDATGAVFLDRDADTFRHILNYLRGYNRFHMLEEEQLQKLRVDAAYFRLQGLQEILAERDSSMDLQFRAGPGVNTERTRARVMYCVASVGDIFMVTGRHKITFQVLDGDYVGIGLVSDACTNFESEFHKTLNCAVYYMSGVFYANFPHHKKEENVEKYETGDYVSVMVDMDEGFAQFTLKKTVRIISIGRARRLRFGVTLKLASRVRIVPPEEAAALEAQRAAEAAAAAEAANMGNALIVQPGANGMYVVPQATEDAHAPETGSTANGDEPLEAPE